MSSQQAGSDGAPAVELLRQIALDLRWSWNHSTDELWRALDADLWARLRNPWVMLQSIAPQRLAQRLSDPALRSMLAGVASRRLEAAQAKSWFQGSQPESALRHVAYFSMEFMLSEALPIYAGGLGNVAGDQLKAASDLGVPVIGVGLLYSEGYFRQVIAADGTQRALYPFNDPGQLPVMPLRGPGGQWLRLQIEMPGLPLQLRCWEVSVGRTKLYLLDSNDMANPPAHRGITSELYGGAQELRLQQEIVLGIGGWRLLEALGLDPEICHLNEGHAAFAILDRARAFMEQSGRTFEEALAVTRAGNVFTTHTAVAAGFDRFDARLMEQYLARYASDRLHLSLRDLLALGREHADDDSESFNMAYLAMRGSGAVNGVSQLHGEVSRNIFQPLYPRWPQAEVPVGSITNGVHTPSWDSAEADALWTQTCGQNRWMGGLEGIEPTMRQVSEDRLWKFRRSARTTMIEYARERLATQLAASGAASDAVDAARRLFDPDTLTLGFARRFATYKRPNLLLHDPERLARLLNNTARPVQLILAGKAHPADVPGQALIRDWVNFIRRSDIRPHAMFLSDYDMSLTEQLVQGVDVWINTPRRPWEACGTSGMKVLVNGGLNLSELDGWWAEAYASNFGWALGDGLEHGADPGWDAAEAAQLYELLENHVVPEFYARDPAGLPRAWLRRVRESMSGLTPMYSANRAVRDYLHRCYLPGAQAYRQRAERHGVMGAHIASWRRALEHAWPTLSIGAVQVTRLERSYRFSVQVHMGALDPGMLQVQLYAETLESQDAVRAPMSRNELHTSDSGMAVYQVELPATRPVGDYTVRIIPKFDGVQVPLEAPFVLWQK